MFKSLAMKLIGSVCRGALAADHDLVSNPISNSVSNPLHNPAHNSAHHQTHHATTHPTTFSTKFSKARRGDVNKRCCNDLRANRENGARGEKLDLVWFRVWLRAGDRIASS
jgi:hypothetical protein